MRPACPGPHAHQGQRESGVDAVGALVQSKQIEGTREGGTSVSDSQTNLRLSQRFATRIGKEHQSTILCLWVDKSVYDSTISASLHVGKVCRFGADVLNYISICHHQCTEHSFLASSAHSTAICPHQIRLIRPSLSSVSPIPPLLCLTDSSSSHSSFVRYVSIDLPPPRCRNPGGGALNFVAVDFFLCHSLADWTIAVATPVVCARSSFLTGSRTSAVNTSPPPRSPRQLPSMVRRGVHRNDPPNRP